MARHRVGQSRPGFKVVVAAIVTVVLCFLHLPISSCQALAIPGSGREATRKNVQKLTVSSLKEQLLGQGLKVTGLKTDLVERLMKAMPAEITAADEKLRLPKAEEPAVFTTDVFIPLNETIRKLDTLLQDETVVFLRAGVASGKSTLGQYLCTIRPSKYLAVPPDFVDATYQNWQIEFRAALDSEPSTRDAGQWSMKDAIKHIYDKDQVLVFDECHLLFACPEFYQLFLKKPPYLERRPMVLLLSAASETQNVQGQIYTTPTKITAKFMWTPPVPHANALVDQLARADVYLSEDAIVFFMNFCGGHRGLFIRAMEWVQKKQSRNSNRWDFTRALGEARHAWDTGGWTGAPDDSLMGKLQTVRAIRVNSHFSDLANIPQEFVDILCDGPTDAKSLTRQSSLMFQ